VWEIDVAYEKAYQNRRGMRKIRKVINNSYAPEIYEIYVFYERPHFIDFDHCVCACRVKRVSGRRN